MQHVNDQHIVPQFLLKQFSKDRVKIWSFDKTAIDEIWTSIKLRPIDSTPTEEHIYDKIKGTPEGSLEYSLNDIENKAAPIIDKLEKKRDLSLLSQDDRVIIALFIMSQLSRTKGGFDNVQFMFSQLNKSWSLAICKEEFYISDNPVAKNNTTNVKEHRSTLGLESKGIEIYLPLSHSVVLCLYCKETFPSYEDTVINVSAENVEYLNWLQVKYSDRFIYSYGSEFELVKDMIEKDQL